MTSGCLFCRKQEEEERIQREKEEEERKRLEEEEREQQRLKEAEELRLVEEARLAKEAEEQRLKQEEEEKIRRGISNLLTRSNLTERQEEEQRLLAKAEQDALLLKQQELSSQDLERKKWAELRQQELDQEQQLRLQHQQHQDSIDKENQARKEAARLKSEAKRREQEEEAEKLANRDSMPIVLWYDAAPEKPTQEEIYLATQNLNVMYEEDESKFVQLVQTKKSKVVAIVTDLYRKDEGNVHSSVAIGLNLANILREEIGSTLPIIVYGERVRKDPKLQTLCKTNGLKPVMRGASLFKLLNVVEPPLGVLK